LDAKMKIEQFKWLEISFSKKKWLEINNKKYLTDEFY